MSLMNNDQGTGKELLPWEDSAATHPDVLAADNLKRQMVSSNDSDKDPVLNKFIREGALTDMAIDDLESGKTEMNATY